MPQNPGVKGFSTIWAVASAADRVIVMMKSVATNPSRTKTKSLPFHRESSRSNMEIEPSPCGLSSATRRKPAVRRTASTERGPALQQEREHRRRGKRFPVGSQESKSNRLRSGTSPATKGVACAVHADQQKDLSHVPLDTTSVRSSAK